LTIAGLTALFRPLEFYLEETIPDLLVHEFKSTVSCENTGILGVNTELQNFMIKGRETEGNLSLKSTRTPLPCSFSQA
jgi:hypothetical protein